MKKYFFFSIFSFFLCAAKSPNDFKIIQISIPKAGTHLGNKCIYLLTKRNPYNHVKYISNFLEGSVAFNLGFEIPIHALRQLATLPANTFINTHLTYSKERADFLNKEKFITFFIYRDPRDQIISLIFYMYKLDKWFPKLKSSSFDEILLDLIIKGSGMNGSIPPATGGIDNMYNLYIPWLNAPGVLSIRFEDLVGAHGGGSSIFQYNAIKNMAHHIGLTISKEKINEIANKLFGNTQTFRKGEIGSWKKYFKKEHKEAFKERAGNILIKLGYEKNFNW